MSRFATLRTACLLCAVSVLGSIVACGSSDSETTTSGPGADSGGVGVVGDGGDAGGGDGADAASADAAKPDGDAGPVAPVDDPAKDGPYTTAASDVTVSAATGDTLTLHVVVPTAGPAAGPYPIVFIGAGYMIATDQYYGYANRLATHGIVGVTVSFSQSSTDQLKDAKDLQAALDWASAPGAALAGVIDATRPGVMGHSRGGKAAMLAAERDTRFKAVLGLDPVDSVPAFVSCDPVTQCPDASNAMGTLTIPSGLLGETLDEAGLITPCAPAADNYATFYAGAPSPSFEVTIAGAGHMSFVDDPSSCLVCDVCKTPTAAQSVVLDLAYSYTAAFFLRYLDGKTAYDTYLTGPTAVMRYVTPGIASIDSK